MKVRGRCDGWFGRDLEGEVRVGFDQRYIVYMIKIKFQRKKVKLKYKNDFNSYPYREFEILIRHKCEVYKVKAYETKRNKPGACLVLSEVLIMPGQSGRTTRCQLSE